MKRKTTTKEDKISISRKEFEEFIKLEKGESVCDINVRDYINGNCSIEVFVKKEYSDEAEKQLKE